VFLHAGHEADITDWLEAVASDSTAAHARKLQQVQARSLAYRDPKTGQGLTPNEQAKEIQKLNSTWNFSRAKMIAITNSSYAYNSGIRSHYEEIGIEAVEWMTAKDDRVCPFCLAMDGQRTLIRDPFWSAGETMGAVVDEDGNLVAGATSPQAEGQSLRTLNMNYTVEHPPLHPYCACVLLPVVETLRIPVQEVE
jgi:SPP1 gp7 family putative phage head morphogenesis protein